MNVNGRPKNWGEGQEYKRVKRLSTKQLEVLHRRVDDIRTSRMMQKEPAIVKFLKEVRWK